MTLFRGALRGGADCEGVRELGWLASCLHGLAGGVLHIVEWFEDMYRKSRVYNAMSDCRF